jgi:hypothetical protein
LLRRPIGISALLSLSQPPSWLPSLHDCNHPSTLTEESIQKKEKAEKFYFNLPHNFEKNESGSDFQRIQIWNDRSQKQKKNFGRHPMGLKRAKFCPLFLFSPLFLDNLTWIMYSKSDCIKYKKNLYYLFIREFSIH